MTRTDKILAICIVSAIIAAGFACVPTLTPFMNVFAVIAIGFFWWWVMRDD